MRAKFGSPAPPFIVAPAKGVHSRQMPGVLVVDITRRVRMANEASVAMLRPIIGADAKLVAGGDLPTTLLPLIDDIEARLALGPGTCSVMLPACDICVRACVISSDGDGHLMLLIERASREDVVRSAIAGYPLTPRESEVAALVLRGYSNRRIAAHLVLTEYTVEDHLKRIFVKLEVRSRSELFTKILGIREQATG